MRAKPIAPIFPGGERMADGRYAFTLGRIGFNALEPLDLRLVIDRITQPLAPLASSEAGEAGDRYRFDAVVEFTIVDDRGAGLRGIVRSLAECRVLDDVTLGVEFTGGTLEPPADGHTADERSRWLALFADPDAQRPAVRPNVSQRLQTLATSLLLKLAFGVQPTSPMTAAGTREFAIARSPVGTLAVRYLDRDLRVFYGEKTIMVATRRSGAI